MARAKSADPDRPSATSGSLPPPVAARRPPAPTTAQRAARAAERAAAAEQKRQAQALDNQLYARLCKLVAKVLDQAGYELSDSQLLRLRQEVKSLRQAYTQPPPLPGPDPQRRRRLQALFHLHETLHAAVERMASKVLLSWQARTGYFTLDPTWRKRWCDLLAD